MDSLAINGGEPTSKYRISLVKPAFTPKDLKDIGLLLRRGLLRQGPYTERFEQRFAEKTGARFAYSVCNGTAALHLAFLSLLEPGCEVIAPAFTFIATISTIYFSQARPVLADVDPYTFLLDLEDVKEKITPKTRAIVPVHLFGNACDMKALGEVAEDHGLFVVSDCAQAHGTEYAGRDVGSYDSLNTYSFYPSKTITTGEGGMVTTNSRELYEKGCLLRSHGEAGRYQHVVFGLNYRITDLASALGLNQLARLDEFLEARRRIGGTLYRALRRVEGMTPQKPQPNSHPSYSYFTLRLELEEFKCSREEFVEALRAENIECAVHYPLALTQQPAVKAHYPGQRCLAAEELSARVLSLPMHPFLTREEVGLIVRAVEKVVSHYHK